MRRRVLSFQALNYAEGEVIRVHYSWLWMMILMMIFITELTSADGPRHNYICLQFCITHSLTIANLPSRKSGVAVWRRVFKNKWNKTVKATRKEHFSCVWLVYLDAFPCLGGRCREVLSLRSSELWRFFSSCYCVFICSPHSVCFSFVFEGAAFYMRVCKRVNLSELHKHCCDHFAGRKHWDISLFLLCKCAQL